MHQKKASRICYDHRKMHKNGRTCYDQKRYTILVTRTSIQEKPAVPRCTTASKSLHNSMTKHEFLKKTSHNHEFLCYIHSSWLKRKSLSAPCLFKSGQKMHKNGAAFTHPAWVRWCLILIVSPLATLAFKLCVVGDTGLKTVDDLLTL